MPNDKWHGEARDAQARLSGESNVISPSLSFTSSRIASPCPKPVTPGPLGAMSLGLELVAILIHLQIAQQSIRYHLVPT